MVIIGWGRDLSLLHVNLCIYTRFGLLAGTGGLGGSKRSSDPPLTVEGELEGEYVVWVCISVAMATDVCCVEGVESIVCIQTAVCSGSLATGLLAACSVVT